jgi:hypothetical protein
MQHATRQEKRVVNIQANGTLKGRGQNTEYWCVLVCVSAVAAAASYETIKYTSVCVYKCVCVRARVCKRSRSCCNLSQSSERR